MAAPVSQQGSRAGLITAVVIFVILFVASTIFAIYYQVQWTASQQLYRQANEKIDEYVRPDARNSQEMLELVTGAKKPEAAMDVILQQRSLLSRDIAGSVLPAAKADTAARSALSYAADRVAEAQKSTAAAGGNAGGADASSQPATAPAATAGGRPTFTDLVSTIRSLSDMVVASNADSIKARAEAATSAKAVTDSNAERDKVRTQAQTDVDAANKKVTEAEAATEQWRNEKTGDVKKIQEAADATIKQLQAGTEKLVQEQSKRDGTIKDLTKQIEGLTNRLKSRRVNTVEATVQQVDGHIIRIPSQDTVFIDVGHQQAVTPGLTFEVYDKAKGIPALGNGMRDEDMPVGKASIEVVHVLPGSSECRVVRHTLGQQLTEGDLIMNLVFDPNTKYNFVVYGSFDMANSGTPTPADAEVMKRLVTQWGGKLMNNVTVDTDFVVMGKEPVVPILSKEDADNPALVENHDKQQAAQDAYLDVRSKAINLGVPLLNQNRFLYFVGYYDSAKR